jgi:cell division protein FtsN
MERQKIFWVVLSVSVFVVVVLVVGVFLLKQKPQSDLTSAPGTVSPLSDLGTQIYEYQREAPASPAIPPENTETMHFYIGEGGEKPPEGQKPQLPVTTPQVAKQPVLHEPATPPARAPAVIAAPAQKAPAIKPSAQTKTARRTVDYWIQTGSYRSQTKAEELATLLGGKGLTGRVFSYAARNGTFYRVRIGPYGNKSEAEKFLSIVKQIEGLESSYVSMVGATKNLN